MKKILAVARFKFQTMWMIFRNLNTLKSLLKPKNFSLARDLNFRYNKSLDCLKVLSFKAESIDFLGCKKENAIFLKKNMTYMNTEQSYVDNSPPRKITHHCNVCDKVFFYVIKHMQSPGEKTLK